jgi:hypothetical protein
VDEWNRGRREEEPVIFWVETGIAYYENGEQHLYRPVPPCNYDFNNIILANPFDGQSHRYVCPRCSVSGTYDAPLEDRHGIS